MSGGRGGIERDLRNGQNGQWNCGSIVVVLEGSMVGEFRSREIQTWYG